MPRARLGHRQGDPDPDSAGLGPRGSEALELAVALLALLLARSHAAWLAGREPRLGQLGQQQAEEAAGGTRPRPAGPGL